MENPDIRRQYSLASYFDEGINPTNTFLSRGENLDSIEKPAEVYSPANPDSLWYALYFPQLAELDEAQQESYLNQLAILVERVSSNITIQSQAIVCEIRSALRYFGGVDKLHETLKEPIQAKLIKLALPEYFSYAACPTVTGSLLLARSGKKTLVYRKENLRSALSKLPIDVLNLSKDHFQKLSNMGIRYLSDVWLLPSNGLQKRFGKDILTTLNKALSLESEPICNFIASPNFSTSYVLPYEIEEISLLLLVTNKMLIKSCAFLRTHDLSIDKFQISLRHHKKDKTIINVGTRLSTRSDKILSKLLEIHLRSLNLVAPVTAIKLEMDEFQPFYSSSEILPLENIVREIQSNNRDLIELMEQLVARLGRDLVHRIQMTSGHCPEYATKQLAYNEIKNSKIKQEEIPAIPRPFLLLKNPKQLTIKNGRLYNKKPIAIISGPERIETYWWRMDNVLRDYYIALEHNGSRLWIYREREEEKKWYLHGYFA